ncbi:MAG: cheB [Verrucomicrobiaceae bacterium]|nr:cheB [Verrucomicrobiaceae bacterium]
MTIKVLVVDDSALVRKVLTAIINSSNDLEVVGAAPDPYVARDMIKQLNPDVLTLDVEMPRMDGLDFLEKLMRLRPMPVVMISSLTEHDSDITFRALELGAVDFVTKPRLGIVEGLEEYTDEIAEKIRAAASARLNVSRPRSVEATQQIRERLPLASTEKIICIGASTGGTEAIKTVLLGMPPDSPGILITQHMPSGFTRSFAERLNKLTRLTVKEAQGNERILPGHVFIAPGDQHLELRRSGANYVTALSAAAPVNRHRPSVDVLFESAARNAGSNALGVVLTGMGKDGALGLLQMKQNGSFTLAQDENTCVVYGMPREAFQIGAVDRVLPLNDIADVLLVKLRESARGVRV